ncbi:pilus assembly protein [Thermodesulfatator indicus DSM 15286]|uniref:Pilus assembly protein n=1 Tax=Thermodesulfatator indicus (strain DSM 15286 / JCM 11887 / CIR29812) TaxID=667014 RepID=F8ACL3_THEID|nr:TrbI/VirB10 family protein [Thermodesulfatator indicus]AEH45788.1 pilus assembly protein [Thermodesulfatator indicus DSM 15286]
MINKLREKFENLDPEKKQQIIRILLVLGVIIIAFYAYQSRNQEPVQKKKEQPGFKEVQPRLGYLEKSLYYETTARVKALEKRLDRLSLELKAINQKLSEQNQSQKSDTFKEIESLRREIESLRKGQPVSGISPGFSAPPPPGGKSSETVRKKPQILGDIGHSASPAEKGLSEQKKKKKNGSEESVYLPPSLIEADLISGFAAPTMEAAKTEPVRAFLRLRDLAILPNEVKQDLKGCFVIAEVRGNLADERAHLRLLRLSCIARDGASVIDEKVKGFVVDEDGKIGLRGRVVTRAGALLARSFIASFLQGFGEAYEQSAYDLTTTATGQIRTLNPGNAVRTGVGKGIASASQNLSRFYLDMARQAFPVIEVGAEKRVVVVFDEGVELHIKKHCLGGKDGCLKTKDKILSLAGL